MRNENGRGNNLIVADSTPLGTHGKNISNNGLDYVAQAELARQAEEARLNRSANINTANDQRHYREMIAIEAEREYGDEKTSRRFEATPEFHTIAEMRELLKRGAFPSYSYSPNSMNMVHVKDHQDYDVVQAGHYYYNVQGKLRSADVSLNSMVMAYTKALRALIYKYPKRDGKGSIRDLLMREFVDQVHRNSRSDVEVGTQVNFIEDYELVTEVSGCEPAMQLLDECYARIEDIDSGLSAYEQYDEEMYFTPSSYPVLDESKRERFLNEYKNLAHQEFANYFAGFDESATHSFYFMMNVLLQMKGVLSEVKTPFGEDIGGYYEGSKLTSAIDHIKATVDIRNSMRKKVQLLSALAYCIELAWDKEPKSQTTTSYIIYRETISGWTILLHNDYAFGRLPDEILLFKDEYFINTLLLNNKEPIAIMDRILSVWSHAKKVMLQMETAHDRDYLGMWDFRSDEHVNGQIIIQGAGENGNDLRVTVESFYENMNEVIDAYEEGVAAELKSLRGDYA